MQYSLSYNTDSDPTDIQLDITSITQPMIDYITNNGSFSITGLGNYTLTVNGSGTNILGVFDNGNITLYISEGSTPDDFSTLTGHIYGYGEEDKNDVYAKVNSVMTQIPSFVTG